MFPRRAHSSLVIFMALSVAFLLLGFLWLLNPAVPSRAQSQPEALGSVSGVVRNAQGDPLPNITVWLEHYQGLYAPRQVTSNAQGVYEFFSVFSGNYVLRFEDNGQEYASSFYRDAHFAEDAEVISVSGNNVTGIDMQLQVGGAISVTLQDAASITYTTYALKLYRQTASGHWTRYLYTNTVAEQNSVLMDGLAAGNYRLCVDSSPYLYWPAKECYDNVLPEISDQLPPNASDILVQAGEETTLAITVNDQTQVEGYILGPNDQPLANIPVGLRTYGNIGGYPSHFAQSDETGYFRFGFVDKGDYSLIFNYLNYYPGQFNDYLKIYYPDEFASVNAAKISIDASTHFSVTKKMTRSASIVGKVTLPNDVPLTYPSIGIYRLRGDNSWSQPWECYEDCPNIFYNPITGVYTVTQLPAGRFRVRADHYIPNSQTTLSAFYGGNSFETADDIVLAAGETRANINFILGATEFDSGISGLVTANGEPKEGIEVGLFPPFNYPPYGPALPLVQTTTNAQGRYSLEGLAIGTYAVGFRDPAGIYATTFYTDPQVLYGNEVVVITQTGILPNVNISLLPGATIRGYVRTEPGKQPGGFDIQILQTYFDIYNAYPLRYVDERTDVNGFYEVTGLSAGSYYVLATTPINSADNPYSAVRYYPAASDLYLAQMITVTTGQIQEGRNIYFSARPTYFMPLLGSALPAPSETPGSAATSLPTPTFTPGGFPTARPVPTATPAFGTPVP